MYFEVVFFLLMQCRQRKCPDDLWPLVSSSANQINAFFSTGLYRIQYENIQKHIFLCLSKNRICRHLDVEKHFLLRDTVNQRQQGGVNLIHKTTSRTFSVKFPSFFNFPYAIKNWFLPYRNQWRKIWRARQPTGPLFANRTRTNKTTGTRMHCDASRNKKKEGGKQQQQ